MAARLDAALRARVSADPPYYEQFRTRLRTAGMGAFVGVGIIGVVVGLVLIVHTAGAFQIGSGFAILGMLWRTGALWWCFGVETRRFGLEVPAAVPALLGVGRG